MALMGQGVLIIWHAMTPEGDLEMIRWHDREHVAERVGIPGFLRGRRYDVADRPREYLDIYETENADTVRSAPYVLRLNFPTEWSKRVLPHFRNTVRLGCRVVADDGSRAGGRALDAPRAAPRRAAIADLERWLRDTAPAALLDETGVIGVHLLSTVPAVTQVKTDEGKLKGGEVAKGEEPWPWVLLVETGGEAFADAIADRYFKPAALAGHGVGRGRGARPAPPPAHDGRGLTRRPTQGQGPPASDSGLHRQAVYASTRFSQYPGRRFAWATASTRTSLPRSMNTIAYGKSGSRARRITRSAGRSSKRGNDPGEVPVSREDTFDLREEFHVEPRPPGSVPTGSLGQFGDRLRREADRARRRGSRL